MKSPIVNAKRFRQVTAAVLLGLVGAIAPIPFLTMPAQAGCSFWDRLLGRTCGGGSGGLGVRDEACFAETRGDNQLLAGSPNVGLLADATEPVDEPTVAASPEVYDTTQASPDIYLYVPISANQFDQSDKDMVIVFDWAEQETDSTRRVILGPVQVPLPEQPGMVKFQLPPLEQDTTYTWSFRLICQEQLQLPIAPDGSAASGNIDSVNTSSDETRITSLRGDLNAQSLADRLTLTVHQEVYGHIRRVSALTPTTSPAQNYDVWLAEVQQQIATELPSAVEIVDVTPDCWNTVEWLRDEPAESGCVPLTSPQTQ